MPFLPQTADTARIGAVQAGYHVFRSTVAAAASGPAGGSLAATLQALLDGLDELHARTLERLEAPVTAG